MSQPTAGSERAIVLALLGDWLAERQRELGVVGLAAGVVLPGDDPVTAAHGLADRESEVPLTAHTPLRAASITKMFSTTAVMIARDEGRLSLDAPLAQLVPELASVVGPRGDPASITLRQVVAHCAGLPHDLPYGVRYWDRSDPLVSFPTATELRHELEGLRLIADPMRSAHYSNVGFMIVGLALAAAFEQPYEHVIRERILDPLGMDDSFFWSAGCGHDCVPSYWSRDGALERAPDFDVGWDTAGGGLCCSVSNLLKFISLHLDRGAPNRPHVLSGDAIREMQLPVFVDAAARFGLGWRLRREGEFTVVGHSGNIAGFSAHMELVPELGIGAALLSNSEASRALISLARAIVQALVALAASRTSSTDELVTPERPADIARCTGRYVTYGYSYDVVEIGRRLAIIAGGQLESVSWLEPTDTVGMFVCVGGPVFGEPVAFQMPRDGRFTEMVLHGQVFGRMS